ncbi:hypothetical protein [Staphylococcus marylandisciuri]|uniref:hypothetical protein n=1 Tax=Staphylococcus marylandisciuri TaxID=2981529 RepID=UPI0021D275E1|nr:hypothetical protein [Staphylococcus marylandisciuri]
MSRGPQRRETDKSVSTSTASWGGAPTKRERDYEIFLFKLDFCPAPLLFLRFFVSTSM